MTGNKILCEFCRDVKIVPGEMHECDRTFVIDGKPTTCTVTVKITIK